MNVPRNKVQIVLGILQNKDLSDRQTSVDYEDVGRYLSRQYDLCEPWKKHGTLKGKVMENNIQNRTVLTKERKMYF